MVAKHLRIMGKVQGVWYRAWTEQTANAMGLTGWVRNCSDGSVEALLIGTEEKVEKMIKACYDGPPAAEISDIEIKEGAPEATQEALNRFETRPTL